MICVVWFVLASVDRLLLLCLLDIVVFLFRLLFGCGLRNFLGVTLFVVACGVCWLLLIELGLDLICSCSLMLFSLFGGWFVWICFEFCGLFISCLWCVYLLLYCYVWVVVSFKLCCWFMLGF